MNNEQKNEWLTELTEFSKVKVDFVAVPPALQVSLRKRLFPNPGLVFSKVLAVHALVGYFSLAICDQFGLNPFQTQQTLTLWFMKIAGHNFCMLLCGTFFMMTTYILSNLVLSLEEIEAIKRHEWLQTGIMGLISLTAFYFFGAELVGAFVLMWILGAFIGGYFSIELSFRLRRVFVVT
jgi:hypothetical protein